MRFDSIMKKRVCRLKGKQKAHDCMVWREMRIMPSKQRIRWIAVGGGPWPVRIRHTGSKKGTRARRLPGSESFSFICDLCDPFNQKRYRWDRLYAYRGCFSSSKIIASCFFDIYISSFCPTNRTTKSCLPSYRCLSSSRLGFQPLRSIF